MSVSYDVFTEAFLSKITEFELLKLEEEDRITIVDGYMQKAILNFKKNCAYDMASNMNNDERIIDVEIEPVDLIEIVDIVSEGMVVQWLKQYVYQQENLQNVLNTKDFTTYSPAELLMRIGNAYAKAQKDYVQMIREYSFNHGELTELHS